MAYLGVQPLKGQNRKLDNISAGFNGGNVTFNLATGGAALTPATAYQLFISVGGVLQDPGVDFTVNGNQITFTTAPATGLSFFGLYQGDAIDSVSVSDGAITSAKLATGLTVTLGAGSTSTPSVTFAGDTNTGIYSPAADTIAFSEGGVEAMRIDSSGRVGIGTTSPAYSLDIVGDLRVTNSAGGTIVANRTSNPGSVVLQHSGTETGQVQAVSGGGLNFYTGSTPTLKATLDNSGRLLVGTSSASAISKFIVQGYVGGSDGFMSVRRGATGGDNQRIGAILFDDSSENVAARIDVFGDGVWGTNDYPGRLVFSTTADNASSPTERMRISQNGVITAQGVYDFTTANAANVAVLSAGQLYRSTSSSKYKTDIETLQDSYADALLDCRPVWYRSTCESDCAEHSWWGFIAEEIAEIDPRLVHWKTVEVTYDEKGSAVETPCDPEPEGVAYDRFVPHLLNLIKRQQQAIETLEAKVAALESA